MSRCPELLAPAGSPDAGYAALQYGADAIYLGLKKFSARADAENFTLDELADIVGYAHSLSPRRRVLVAVNTLVLQDELPGLIRALGEAYDIGADAAIVQDLGVFRIVRRYFPRLEIHASTQMAVHNLEGARTLRRLGLSRVILARELSIREIRGITEKSGIETEAFVHGTLCCSCSGLCLFSSFALGRSGNRGKCAYLCRDRFDIAGCRWEGRHGETDVHGAARGAGRAAGRAIGIDRGERFGAKGEGFGSEAGSGKGTSGTTADGRTSAGDTGCRASRGAGPPDGFSGLPFSMRDLCLADRLEELRASGVAALKIEGRKRSPLYVAAVTKLYRGLLDGTLDAEGKAAIESDLRTIFSRPWTELYAVSRRPDRPAAGPGTIGHGGERIGRVEAVVKIGAGKPFVRFRTSRALELHDGVHIEIPGNDRPFGFAIEKMRVIGVGGGARPAFEAPAGATVEVALPEEGYPTIPEGAPVFCSSSGAVKRRYRFERPKPGAYRRGRIAVFEVEASGGGIRVSGTVEAGPGGVQISGAISLPGDIRPAKDPGKTRLAAEDAFRRLGGTGLEYGGLKLANPRGLFVPKSLFNEARRKIVEVLTRGIAEAKEKRLAAVCAEVCPDPPGHSAGGEEDRPSEAAPPPDRTALAGDRPRSGILSGEPAGGVPDGAAASAPDAPGGTGQEKQDPATGAGTDWPRPVRASGARPAWSVRVQRASAFDAFDGEDWDAVAEAVLDLSLEPADVLLSAAERISAIVGRDRVRFALPTVTRHWEDAALRGKIRALQGAGWNRWEASNLSAWGYLDVPFYPERPLSEPEAASSPGMSKNLPTGREVTTALELRARGSETGSLKGEAAHGPGGDQSRIAGGLCAASGTSGPDIAADWAVYVVNRMAAAQALEMGASRFTLSPEDGLANMRRLLAEFSDRAAVIVYQDTPLMISESCAWAALTGGCPGSLRCRFSEIEARSERSGDILILNSGCRTVVVGKRPLCLASRLRDLLDAGARLFRAEFSWRRYGPEHVRDIFRSLRAGRDVPGSRQANFDRGLE